MLVFEWWPSPHFLLITGFSIHPWKHCSINSSQYSVLVSLHVWVSVKGVDDVGLPYLHRWGDGSSSPLTTNRRFVSLPLKWERVSLPPRLHCLRQAFYDSPQSRETGNGAERRDSPARDWNQYHPPTHICTDAPKPPGSPICFLTCHSQRCFSASLTIDYSQQFWPAGT